MGDLLQYLVYAAAFIAIVGAIEGAWFLIGNRVGDDRTITQRLFRAGSAGKAQAAEVKAPGPLERFLATRAPWLGAALTNARSGISPVHVLLAACMLTVSVFMVMTVVGAPRLFALVAALAVGGGFPTILLRTLGSRRRRKFLDQLPQAVDLMARGLQAGHPVSNAMAVVAKQMPDPIGSEFQIVIEEMTYGLERDVALSNLLKRFPLPELRMMVASLEVTRETGGNLAEVFLKLAEAIRAKAQLRKKVHAITAEGRMSFWVVSALPVVVGGLLMVLRPTFYGDVAGDPLFWPMMSISPLFLTIGATIIWRMVNLKI